jgi:regulation of enolase protein 1 (concanavalin A-like superfamily)
MSEFICLCPICHQRILSDSAHAGKRVACPVCFREIIAPSGPAESHATPPPPSARPAANGILIGILVLVGVSVLLGGAFLVYRLRSTPSAPAPAASAPPMSAFPVTARSASDPAAPFAAPGWQTTDIGDTGLAGSASQGQGVFSISGSGTDVWGTADAFRFVYQPLNGDGTLTARVLKVAKTADWAKAGLMIRESLDANAKFVDLFAAPIPEIALQERDDLGSDVKPTKNVTGLGAPYWLRLTRVGNKISAYISENGTTWLQTGATTMEMAGQVEAGLFVCSRNNSMLCEGKFDNVVVKSGTPR